MYTSQSLNNINYISLVDGIQKYKGTRKVIYKMNRSVLLCCEHQVPFLGESVPRDL